MHFKTFFLSTQCISFRCHLYQTPMGDSRLHRFVVVFSLFVCFYSQIPTQICMYQTNHTS